MAHGEGGTTLDEPPHETRRERRERSRHRDRSHRPRTEPESAPDAPAAPGPRHVRRLQAERRRFWLVLMPIVAVLLAVTALVGAAIRSDSDSTSGGGADRDTTREACAATTLLFGHRGADGRLDLLVLIGTRSGAASVLLFPVATQVEVPSLGPTELAELGKGGDEGLLQTTVENLLGVRVAKTLVVDDAGLLAALAPSARLPVNLHGEVQFAGTTEAIVPGGPLRAKAGEAARLLVARQAGSELDRLVTVQDVLDGWMRRLRNRAIARETLAAHPALGGLVAAASASDRRTDTLPVESVTTGGSERFEPRVEDLSRYVVAAFPNALLAIDGARPRVEILNGTGAVGLAQTIAARVVPAGGQVTLTGNVANFGLTNTQIVYYRRRDRAAAQRLLRALGCGTLKEADTALGVVDVTILAGADCFRTGTTPAP